LKLSQHWKNTFSDPFSLHCAARAGKPTTPPIPPSRSQEGMNPPRPPGVEEGSFPPARPSGSATHVFQGPAATATASRTPPLRQPQRQARGQRAAFETRCHEKRGRGSTSPLWQRFFNCKHRDIHSSFFFFP